MATTDDAATDLLAAAKAFLAQWKVVAPHINSAFVLQFVHGAQYDGPTIGREVDALTAAVEKAEARVP